MSEQTLAQLKTRLAFTARQDAQWQAFSVRAAD